MLEKIQKPKDLRKLSVEKDLPLLAGEIRQYLITTLSQIEHSHFSSNLGVVELTLALHYVFDTPNDLLFWDTGHQGYVHKMLTGRYADLPYIRNKGGISGFLDRAESDFDAWGAGHAGTALSAAIGSAVANKLLNNKKNHIAIIGDASLAAGMTFEALNHLAETSGLNLTIVVNDNNCSIDPTVGGLHKHFQRLAQKTNSTNFFSALDLDYEGPIDGHDLTKLIEVFSKNTEQQKIRVLHVITKKGKGYLAAEQGDAAHWHAPGKFFVQQTQPNSAPKRSRYQDVFAQTIMDLAEKNTKIVAVSAGMLTGTSLIQFQKAFPERCFDVGIAEQHAVTFSAGLATQGLIPFCAIYATFLQRALDQVIHDVALQKLPVVFCVDRAGLVGHDGATHQGVFDLSFLRSVPNLQIASPSSAEQLKNLIYTAQKSLNTPLVIRYPRGYADVEGLTTSYFEMPIGKAEVVQEGEQIALLSLGTILSEAKIARQILAEQGILIGLFDMIFVKPLDEEILHHVAKNYKKIIVLEETVLAGGFSSAIAEFLADKAYKNNLLRIGLPDIFVEHASQEEQRELFGLTGKQIANRICLFSKDNRFTNP